LAALVQHTKATLVDWPLFSIAVYLQQANAETVSYVMDEYMQLLKRQNLVTIILPIDLLPNNFRNEIFRF